MNLKNKKVLVIGLAVTGIPLVQTLAQLGAEIIVNDFKTKEDLKESLEQLKGYKIEYILGKHPSTMDEVGVIDLVVVSPGVPLNIPFIQNLKKQNIEVIGEIELAYRLSKAPFIAITGTNGKTTTTALTGEIFKNAGVQTHVVGNIGVVAISKVLNATEDDAMITEVSSFQLESIVDFHPRVAAILNLTPDHLNRHKTMENYIETKFNVFSNQGPDDFAIINYDDQLCREHSKNLKSQKIYFSRKVELTRGVFVKEGYIMVKDDTREQRIVATDQIYIQGKHNLENALAAVAIAYAMDIDYKVIESTLKEFKGVAHRTEIVDEIKGIKFINDSKATNVDAAIKALEAIDTPILLLAGGLDKGSKFDDFIKAFNGKVKKMFVYGETAEKLSQTAFKIGYTSVIKVKNLEEAVINAYRYAQEGDTILLSPACASWDMYKSFEERGNHFKEIVANLRRS